MHTLEVAGGEYSLGWWLQTAGCMGNVSEAMIPINSLLEPGPIMILQVGANANRKATDHAV